MEASECGRSKTATLYRSTTFGADADSAAFVPHAKERCAGWVSRAAVSLLAADRDAAGRQRPKESVLGTVCWERWLFLSGGKCVADASRCQHNWCREKHLSIQVAGGCHDVLRNKRCLWLFTIKACACWCLSVALWSCELLLCCGYSRDGGKLGDRADSTCGSS